MKSLILLAAMTVVPQPVDASCMRVELKPVLLTRRDTKLPADGGVLVGFGYSTNSEELEQTGADPSDVKWTATDGKRKSVALTRTALAPGLSVWRPADGVTAFTLANTKKKPLGTFTRDDKPAAILAAPKPRSIEVKTTDSFRSTTTIATLELTVAPPPEAVAVIVYSDPKTAAAYETLPDTHDKLTSLQVFHSGGHCSNNVAGQGYLSGGAKITFAYVDAFGRLSAQSAPITAK